MKKTKDIQTYISSIGKTEHLHVFVAKSDSIAEDTSTDSSLDIWRDLIFTKKISKSDVIGIIPNSIWTSGNVYYPWKSNKQTNQSYYAWNRENGNVYLCLQNNSFNRIDREGQNASTYLPTHAYGIQSYPDGYSWLPIYRITGDLLRFVKTDWIPIISFENFDENSFTSEFDSKYFFCDNNISATGSCALYFSDTTQIATSGISFDVYDKGQLYTSFVSDCSSCYTLFNDNDKFENVFYRTGETVQTTITIEDKFDLIGRLISENKLPGSSPYYALYEIANNGPDDGAIISAQIDLNGITGDDLVVNVSNPSVTVTSSSGSGASLRLLTYNSIDGKYIIEGVEVVSNGSNYRDLSLSLSSSIFVNTNISDLILSAININYDNIDGLNIDPYDVLNCTNVMVDTRIDTNDLISNGIALPDSINMFGLVSNPLEDLVTGETIISGSELSPFSSKINTGSSIVSVYFPGDDPFSSPSVLPSTGNALSTSSTTSGSVVTPRLKILKDLSSDEIMVFEYPSLPYETVMSITGINYTNISTLSTITDSSDNTFNVNAVINKPTLKQYSGKVLQTKKSTNELKLTSSTGIISKIIRINMIKGL
jgi:hypothetical protein